MRHELTTYGLPAAGTIGLLYGTVCFVLLRRWIGAIRGARIVVGRKRKTVLDSSLYEWLEWERSLPADVKGRAVVHLNGITVAICRPEPPKVEVVKPGLRERFRRREQAAA